MACNPDRQLWKSRNSPIQSLRITHTTTVVVTKYQSGIRRNLRLFRNHHINIPAALAWVLLADEGKTARVDLM